MWRSVALGVLVGCGGISPGTPINDVDAEGWAKLCEELTADSVDLTQDCGAYEASFPAYTQEDCEADAAFMTAGCSAVVGDWQTCWQGRLNADLCNPQVPSACGLIAECSPI